MMRTSTSHWAGRIPHLHRAIKQLSLKLLIVFAVKSLDWYVRYDVLLRCVFTTLMQDLRDLEQKLKCGEESGCGWTLTIPYRYVVHPAGPYVNNNTNQNNSSHRLATCGHVFCFECIEAIFDSNTWYDLDTCPTCKAPILEPPKRDSVVEDVLSWLRDMKGEAPPRVAEDIDPDYFNYRFEEARLAYHRLTSID